MIHYVMSSSLEHPKCGVIKNIKGEYVVGRPSCRHEWSKVSELVPCSLLPYWNSMPLFATVSLSDMNSLQEVKFATLSGKVQTRHKYCNLYVTMLWLRHVRAGTEISKKLTSNPRLSAKNTPLFLFPQMGHSLQILILSKLCPTYSCIQLYT